MRKLLIADRLTLSSCIDQVTALSRLLRLAPGMKSTLSPNESTPAPRTLEGAFFSATARDPGHARPKPPFPFMIRLYRARELGITQLTIPKLPAPVLSEVRLISVRLMQGSNLGWPTYPLLFPP